MEELLAGYAVVVKREIEWGDMDAFRHVNNVNYFRFQETARVVYGVKIGITERMETEGIGPILAKTDCRYIKPVVFPDTLSIGIRTASVEGSEVKMEYEMASEDQNTIVAAGSSIVVLYDYRNKKRVDAGDAFIARIESVEGRVIPRKHS